MHSLWRASCRSKRSTSIPISQWSIGQRHRLQAQEQRLGAAAGELILFRTGPPGGWCRISGQERGPLLSRTSAWTLCWEEEGPEAASRAWASKQVCACMGGCAMCLSMLCAHSNSRTPLAAGAPSVHARRGTGLSGTGLFISSKAPAAASKVQSPLMYPTSQGPAISSLSVVDRLVLGALLVCSIHSFSLNLFRSHQNASFSGKPSGLHEGGPPAKGSR